MTAYLGLRARPILLAANVAALRAAPLDQLTLGQLTHIETGDQAGWLVRWDPAETAADDDERYFTPASITEPAPGRYVTYAATTAIPNALALRDDAGALPDVGGGSSPDFAAHVLHVNDGGAAPSTGLYGLSVNYTLGAARRGVFWDPANGAWAFAEDTAGDDTTISAYLPVTASTITANDHMQSRYFRSDAASVASTGRVRFGVGDEIKGVVSAADYRLAAILAGPIVALGDATVATTTLDAATTLQLTSRLGAVTVRAATNVAITNAAGSSTFFHVDTGTGITKAVTRFQVYDAAGTTLALDVNPGTPAILVGARIDTTTAAALTFGGGNATSVAMSGLGITGCASVANAGGALALTAGAGALTLDASAAVNIGTTNATSINVGHGTILTTITGTTVLRQDAIAALETTGVLITNETAAAAGVQQRSPYVVLRGQGWKTISGGSTTIIEVGDQLRPVQGGTLPSAQWYFSYRIPGNTGSWSTFGFFDSNNSSFGVVLTCSTFVTSGNGFRLTSNGGGVKENGSARALFQNATAGEPWEGTSSTSTGNTGARFQLTCDAGTPTAGTALRVGFGSGSFATSLFEISTATATMGHVRINGIDIGWNVRNVAFADSPVTAVIGDRFNVDTTLGIVVILLPAVPTSLVSARATDIRVKDAKGTFNTNKCTVTPAGANKIDNVAASIDLVTAFANTDLCHDGDASNWRVS